MKINNLENLENSASQNGSRFAMANNLFLFNKQGSKFILTIFKNQIQLKGSCQRRYSKGYIIGSEGNSNTVQCLEQWHYYFNKEVSPKVITLQRVTLI